MALASYSLDEVAKHATKTDCWVVVNGQVLNVTNFLKDHPGGELAILTFAGKDATEEFNMIHPPDVIPKYAPDAIIGSLGGGAAPAAAAAAPAPAGGGVAAPLLAKGADSGDAASNEAAWGEWRDDVENNPGVLIINISTWIKTVMYVVLGVVFELFRSVFSANNIKITGDRSGLTRSAILLLVFMVIHAVGNLHIFLGPDDFNGYGYFYVRLYGSGLGLPANIVEEYVALCALLHIVVGLKRTWDISLKYPVSSGKLNLAITGVLLLSFMTIHLFQFRFGDCQPYLVRPPPYLINFEGILQLHLFWTEDTSVEPVPVRDIYKLEFDLFQNAGWAAYYMFSICVFMTHGCLGWQKAVPVESLGIPKAHQFRAKLIGYALVGFIGLCYLSFPIYTRLVEPSKGALGQY